MTWNDGIIHGQGFGVVEPTQNFANSDERLLDDRNRPRDQYGFRLQPGRQMGKNDYRQSNRGITEYLKIFGGKESDKNIFVPIPFAFDNTGKLELNQTYRYTASQYEKWLKSTKIGKTSWGVKNNRLVVPETGLYIINYLVRFTFPTGATFSADPKCIASLDKIEDGVADGIDSVQGHFLFLDYGRFGNTKIEYLKGGTELALYGYFSTTSSYKCLIRGCIEIMQVS